MTLVTTPTDTIAHHAREHATSLILSAVAGYVDTAGYLSLFGLFTAHVTGNFVTAGAAIARHVSDGALAKLAVIPIFMASVAATALTGRSLRRQGIDPLRPLLALMTVALAVFWATGVALQRSAIGPDTWAVVVIGGAGVAALGIQNALMREVFGTFSQTTVMTGNLTQVTLDLVRIVSGPDGADPKSTMKARADTLARLSKFGIPLAGFVTGAALGAWLTGAFGLWSLGVPTLAVGALTLKTATQGLHQ